jgi:signal transduction histidine kinase/ActR/RegA family two-component response regulator
MSVRSETTAVWTWVASLTCGVYALVGGFISLIGWVADKPRLTDWLDDGISIQPNPTVAAMLGGGALFLLALGFRRAAYVSGVIVAAIGATVLFQNFTGIDLRIDTLLMFGREWGRTGVLFPGRMGLPGAASWTLLGISIVIAAASPVGGARLRMLVPLLASLTMTIASFSLIGYLYGADTLYAIPTFTVIALQTSTFILAVSLGLILAIPEYGPTRLLTESGPAGTLVRRILPALIVVPLIVGFLRLAGERAGWYDLALGTASRTVAEVALFIALLWWTAGTISRQTRARTRAEDELRENKHQLQSDLADSQLLQRVSAEIIREGNEQSLYDAIVDAAMVIMQSRCASIQIFERERQELKLLSVRGFDDHAMAYWDTVSVNSVSPSGLAFQERERILIADVLAWEGLSGSEDLKIYRRLGVRAVQSTPLFSRTGELMGMISTHWGAQYHPTERAQRVLDILARQAADLIERRRSAEALRHADRRKDEFLMTLAHELRNPLAPIRSAVDFMKQLPALDKGEVARARDVLDRQTALMARLLDDLLDVGRIARDTLELRTRRVEVGPLIRDGVDMNRPLVEEFGHNLTVTIPGEPMYLNADPARLSQVFGNLLNNACRYTPSGGRILLAVERLDGEVVVRIRDNGIGIPSDRLASIFDMFSQVDRSLERAQRGLGIGLHLVKRLVEMHGGSVTAHSEGPGIGSELTVRLPLLTDTAQPDIPRTGGQPEAAPISARRILVVDDNVDAAQSLAMLLEVCGHETHMAHDGLAAVEAAERVRPDVILLDIGLPRLNGFDACRQIREQPWGKNMVMIALTGWGQDVDRRRSEESGFDHHIVKPVEHETLVRLLGSDDSDGASRLG